MATENPAVSPAAAWEISYRGAARLEAEELRKQFELAGAPVCEPREAIRADAKLGAEEIIITIVASAALKAVAQVAFDHLRSYLVHEISEREEVKKVHPNLQVVVKKHTTDPGKKELLSLRVASVQMIDKFISNIAEAVIKAIVPAA
jgi:hypothetical protein